MTIENRLQVVTGGTSGMGLATAKRLGEFGPVLIGGRSEKRLESALAELREAGVRAFGKPCDVSDVESVRAFRDYALELGEIGSVVNAAGVDFDNASIDLVMNVNMGGVINVTQEFFPYMDHAVMAHYSSITGYFYQPTKEDFEAWNNPHAADFIERATAAVRRPEMAPGDLNECFPYYAASKRFVMHYVMANASRFGEKGNRIFSVAPGSFDTPMLQAGNTPQESIIARTAFKRFGTPEEMADLFIDLMKPGHDYLTGCDIVMDGGKTAMTLVPQIAA